MGAATTRSKPSLRKPPAKAPEEDDDVLEVDDELLSDRCTEAAVTGSASSVSGEVCPVMGERTRNLFRVLVNILICRSGRKGGGFLLSFVEGTTRFAVEVVVEEKRKRRSEVLGNFYK